MKQLVRKGLKHMVVEEVPDPMLVAHHILVRPSCSLISSGTETASIHHEGVLRAVADNPSQLEKIWSAAKSSGPGPTLAEVRAKFSELTVLGYSGAGVIVDKHPTVTDLEIGDRVAYGGEGTGHGETLLVGRNLAAKVDPALPFEQACFTTLGSIAMNGVRIANIGLGERVAVIGLGLVGQLVAQLARLQGAYVIATDLKPIRVDLAKALGADVALVGDAAVRAQIIALTGGVGVDCVMIAAASKSSAACDLAVDICRDRGRIVDLGAVKLSFPWELMYKKEIQFLMARAYGPGSYDPAYEVKGQDYPLPYVRWTENRNMQEFLRLMATGRVQVGPLVTHEFPLDEAPKAYETILDPTADSLAVLLRHPSAASANPAAEFRPTHRLDLTTPPSRPSAFGVGLVGAGNLARWTHLPNLTRVPGVRLRAIHSSSGVRGKSYGLRFKADYCATDYAEILRDPKINVVAIVSRNASHATQALAALRAGKHVFVEKPMALTEEECRQIYAAVRETGLRLTVGFNRRYANTYRTVKQQLNRRTGPAVLNCRVNSPGISGSYWMADPSIGGAILGEACHFVDLFYWLIGAEPVSVSAYSLPTGSKDPIGENNVVASFRFADGSIANLTYCTVGSATSGGERLEAFAPGVGVMAEDFKRSAVRTSMVRTSSSWFAEKGYGEQMRAFFRALAEGAEPDIDVRDGVRATLGCLRLMESARTQAPCAIDLDAICGLGRS
jgi:predicted dehydrogenase/threonine dehydrogenase-like Zn-dependent dehydrogenase